MFIQRRSVALIALVALLFGNAAGWVHVGCHQHCHSNECHLESVLSESGLSESGLGELSPSDCCGAHHHHGDHQHADHNHGPDPSLPPDLNLDSLVVTDSPVESGDAPCGHDPHEHDECSICQAFFASRDGIVLPSELTTFWLATVSTDAIVITAAWLDSVEPSSTSVRVPPIA